MRIPILPDSFGFARSATRFVASACAVSIVLGAAVASEGSLSAVQEVKLLASDGAAGDQFGRAVVLDGQRAVIGAPRNDAPGQPAAGAAYVFVESGGVWNEVQKLRGFSTVAGDDFGTSVDIWGDTIVVGARNDDNFGTDSGTAFVFERLGSQWVEQDLLFASDPQIGRQFGISVAVQDDVILVGAPARPASTWPGAVYVFERSGSDWSQVQRLESNDPVDLDNFGFSLALDGDTAMIGSPSLSFLGTESVFVYERSGGSFVFQQQLVGVGGFDTPGFGGRIDLVGDRALVAARGQDAAVFERTGTTWTQAQLLDAPAAASVALGAGTALVGTPSSDAGQGRIDAYQLRPTGWRLGTRFQSSDVADGDQFSVAVSASEDRVLVGARFDDDGGNLSRGAAYIYRVIPVFGSGTEWAAFSEARVLGTPATEQLGSAVDLSGGHMVAGAPNRDHPAAAGAGSAFVFRRSGSEWLEQAELIASDASAGARLGASVSLDAERAVVGAPFETSGSPPGAAYVFRQSGSSWIQEAKLVASDAIGDARVGTSVSLDAERVAVGAPDAGASGAVYVFLRNGTQWSEEAKLVAPDANPGDMSFGEAVALQGDTLVVGMPREDNINGVDAGALYVYRRSGTSWSFLTKFGASDGVFQDQLGATLGFSGDLLVAGAPQPQFTPGKAYVFGRQGTQWAQFARLDPSDGFVGDRFGSSVAIDAQRILVGSPFQNGLGTLAGVAYVFEGSGTSWTEEAQVCVFDTGREEDRLGTAVALDGATAAVGAPFTVGGGSVFVVTESAPFASFCDASDGALASCPCGNPGDVDSGCDLPQLTGGVSLRVLAQDEVTLNRATLSGVGYPPANTPSAVVIRSSGLDQSSPVVFGDGLRCVGTPVVRLAGTLASGGGSTHVIGHGSMAGSGTFFYQLWFRSTPGPVCTPAAFNLSNGRQVTW